jgi:hypothetical protein
METCKHCEEKEQKGIERHYKKELKRYIKEMHRYEEEIEFRSEESSKLKEVVANLMKEIDQYKDQQLSHKYEEKEWESKYNHLR